MRQWNLSSGLRASALAESYLPPPPQPPRAGFGCLVPIPWYPRPHWPPDSCPWHMTTDAFHQGNNNQVTSDSENPTFPSAIALNITQQVLGQASIQALWQMLGGDVGGRASLSSSHSYFSIQVPGMSQNSGCHPWGYQSTMGWVHGKGEADFPWARIGHTSSPIYSWQEEESYSLCILSSRAGSQAPMRALAPWAKKVEYKYQTKSP